MKTLYLLISLLIILQSTQAKGRYKQPQDDPSFSSEVIKEVINVAAGNKKVSNQPEKRKSYYKGQNKVDIGKTLDNCELI